MLQGDQEQLLMLVNGTICLTGAIRLGNEDCSLFSETFLLSLGQSGQYFIKQQIFKVHKPRLDDGL